MNKITTVIIDDEVAAAENISILLENYCPEVSVLGMAHSISSGIKMVKNLSPDLVFLDISMPPEGTGFDFLEMFPNRNFHVVFVTAYEEYSLKAIKQHAFDYILKPIDYKELTKTISHYLQLHGPKYEAKKTTQDYITLSTEEGTHVINPEQISFCKASGSYTEFHFKDRPTILISKPLKFAENLLTSNSFKRVHRSYLVNSKMVTKFTKEDGGFICINDVSIPVSKNYFENIIDILK
jgi:two-component system LytT family response regulator